MSKSNENDYRITNLSMMNKKKQEEYEEIKNRENMSYYK